MDRIALVVVTILVTAIALALVGVDFSLPRLGRVQACLVLERDAHNQDHCAMWAK